MGTSEPTVLSKRPQKPNGEGWRASTVPCTEEVLEWIEGQSMKPKANTWWQCFSNPCSNKHSNSYLLSGLSKYLLSYIWQMRISPWVPLTWCQEIWWWQIPTRYEEIGEIEDACPENEFLMTCSGFLCFWGCVESTISFRDPKTEVTGTDQFLWVPILILCLLLLISPRYSLLRASVENFLSCGRPSEDC